MKRIKWENDDLRKAKFVEYLLYILYPSVILSLCLMGDMLMFNTTNSKQAVNLLGDKGPYGQYGAMRLCYQTNQMTLLFLEKNILLFLTIPK